nr:hypothetical protein [Prolixibacteraceae bacterium]
FLTSPTGVMNPLDQVLPPDSRLEGFNWRNNERPVNKYDIFRNKDDATLPTQLPRSEIRERLPNLDNLRKGNSGPPDQKELPVQ